MAAGLDPLWVARVARPPLGVYADHLAFESTGAPVLADELAEVTSRLDVQFPAEYSAFLLNWNGGVVGNFLVVETATGTIEVPSGVEWRFAQLTEVRHFEARPNDRLPPVTESLDIWLSRHVYIGRDPDMIGAIFLGIAGQDFGTLRILDTSVELEASLRFSEYRRAAFSSLGEFFQWLPQMPPSQL